jgi:endonuclease/exonuclease/phosphatase family metal-dependent hydrolase
VTTRPLRRSYLEETQLKNQKYNLVIAMGDFNKKIGKEGYQKKAAGKYLKQDIRNKSGNLIRTVCYQK